MKKFAILFLAVCLAGGTVMAQEEGLGLYVGAELTIPDFEYAGDLMLIRPYLGYESSFDAIDLNAELGVDVLMGESDSIMGLDLNIGAGYNLSVGDASTLTLGLGTWVFFPFDDKKGMYTENTPYGVASPSFSSLSLHLNVGAMFTQTMDFGDLYFGIDLPFVLVEKDINPFDYAELQFTAGTDTEIGLGAGLILYGLIQEEADFIQLLEIFASYTTGPVFFGVTFGIPLYENGFDNEGLTITPEIEFSFDFGLSLYASLPVSGVSTDTTSIGLTVGAKFSF